MAIRTIRIMGDEILTHVSKPIKEMTPRIQTLIEDMLETMYQQEGVGLAAVQVGVLKRIVVIDTSEDANHPLILINPEIVETSGEQSGYEGCLSLPGKMGIVVRPNYCKVKACNEKMEEIIVEGEELLARALVHELEHLDGKMYVEKVEEGTMVDNTMPEQDD